MKNFNHLHPEWEVRDFHNGYRYLDLAYLPGNGVKGGIEIQGYGPHARDLDVRRFKDLCWRQCLLTLEDWLFLPIAYLSIKDEPKQCQQLVLAFMGKFMASDAPRLCDMHDVKSGRLHLWNWQHICESLTSTRERFFAACWIRKFYMSQVAISGIERMLYERKQWVDMARTWLG